MIRAGEPLARGLSRINTGRVPPKVICRPASGRFPGVVSNRGPDVEVVGRLIGGPNQMAELVTEGADAILGGTRLLQPAFPFFTMTLNGVTRPWSTRRR